jgi:hypothetical protein
LEKKYDPSDQTECPRTAESLRTLIKGIVEMKRPHPPNTPTPKP